MDVFPKFIIEDDEIIIGKCTYHKQLAYDTEKVSGGGMFQYDQESNTFTLSGKSHDFGEATKEDIFECLKSKKIRHRSRNMYDRHEFAYKDIHGEVTNFIKP